MSIVNAIAVRQASEVQSQLFTNPHDAVAPGWMVRGACATGLTPHEADDLFHPDERSNFSYADAVRDYCSKCPVIAECLAFGLGEEYGLWGGLTPRQRRGLQKAA